MKKILVLLGLLLFPLAASASLYSYYQEQGQPLPSVNDRAPVAVLAGIVQNPWEYTGAKGQNESLESYLRAGIVEDNAGEVGNEGPMIGATISRPELFYSETLSRGLVAGGSETTTYVSVLPSETTGYMIINPLSPTNRELIKYTGVTTTGGNQLTGVTRGLSPTGTTGSAISDSRVAANAKRHSAGEVIAMNNGRYEQLIIDQLNGITTSSISATDAAAFRFQYLPLVPTTTPTDPRHPITLDFLANVTSTACINASSTVRGCVQEATTSTILSGQVVGSTGALNFLSVRNVVTTSDYATKVGTIPALRSDSQLDSSFGGNPGALAQLDGNQKVVQNPASATSTPGVTSTIVMTSSTTGRINPAYVGTSTNNGDFLRSTSTGAYWGSLGSGGYVSTTVAKSAMDTTYRNTSTLHNGRALLVIIHLRMTGSSGSGGGAEVLMSASSADGSPANVLVGKYELTNEGGAGVFNSGTGTITILVPSGFYWQVTNDTATAITSVLEIEI